MRFTTKTWNLTTHRIDPDVDEARDYVIEDLLQAERIEAAGYVDGVGPCDADRPRRNLTGDPYFTDGKRAVILLSSAHRAALRGLVVGPSRVLAIQRCCRGAQSTCVGQRPNL